MRAPLKIGYALSALLMLLVGVSEPANAQFSGVGDERMQQFAPMLQMMKKRLGKRRFGHLMQMMGPMLANMDQVTAGNMMEMFNSGQGAEIMTNMLSSGQAASLIEALVSQVPSTGRRSVKDGTQH
jgi:alanine-alpha-ketoisovalerate/valine-pyruvate aminotransferase